MSVIKELQKTNVMGIIPSTPSFGIPEGIKGLEALINRIPYWPKHILDQLPGAKKKVLKNTIKLTQRQAQIVNLISERGLTNKKIAQALNITESTVKIHVSAILKAYGVRTRTQLALAAIK
jgi:DNA-binding NarL/FixJ family response regulator